MTFVISLVSVSSLSALRRRRSWVGRSWRYVLDMADELAPGFVNHLRLSVHDVEASGRFYDPLMRCLGFTPEPRDDDGRAWGTPDATGRMQWLILTAAAAEHAGLRHTDLAPGLHHLAFNARDRAHVDEVHEVLLGQAAEIIEAPSEYDDDPDCYAVFFRDPDGFKLEVLHVRR
jgi:catechol 2,3-dioxygenase-like lactoylglutathione lyase family enzyme